MLRNKIQFADIELPDDEDNSSEQGADDVEKKNLRKENYGYFKINYDKDTGLMQSYELNKIKITRKRLLAGYFASIWHRLDFSAMEAFHRYKLRDEQKKYFE